MKFKFCRGSALVWSMAILAVIVGVAITAIGSYISAANYGNRTEVQLKTLYQNNQNILGQYTIRIKEMAQVPEMYTDDLRRVLVDVMSARMGEDGSKAMFQWFQEQNIQFDSTMYRNIQQEIAAGRKAFEVAQTRLLDERATYEANLGYVWTGFWLKLAGYPKVDLALYNPVVASNTAQVFEQKVDEPAKLR